MSNVIQFLESAGRNAMLSPADYAAAVAALDVDDVQRQALLDRDHAGLNRLLDGRMKMIFMVSAPREDEPEFFPDDDGGERLPDEDQPEPLQE